MFGEDLTMLSKMCHLIGLYVYIGTVLLFLFGSINRFLKQNVSLDQHSFVLTFVAQQLAYFGVLASYRVVQNLGSSNFEDLKIVGDLQVFPIVCNLPGGSQ